MEGRFLERHHEPLGHLSGIRFYPNGGPEGNVANTLLANVNPLRECGGKERIRALKGQLAIKLQDESNMGS